MKIISVTDVTSFAQGKISTFCNCLSGNITRAKIVCVSMQAVVAAAAICADKTLISLNILNSNEHTHAAQQTREGKRVRCAAQVCSFEFKILRLIRVLSTQIAVIYIEPSYRHYVGCWLSSVLSQVKTCVDWVFTLTLYV